MIPDRGGYTFFENLPPPPWGVPHGRPKFFYTDPTQGFGTCGLVLLQLSVTKCLLVSASFHVDTYSGKGCEHRHGVLLPELVTYDLGERVYRVEAIYPRELVDPC